MVSGPSIVVPCKDIVDEIFIRSSKNVWKSIVVIDCSQPSAYSKCKRMPTGFYNRWECNSDTQQFTPRQNKSPFLEDISFKIYQRTRPDWKIDGNITTCRQKKDSCFSVDGVSNHRTLLLSFGVILLLLSLSRKPIVFYWGRNWDDGKKREQNEMRRQNHQQKKYQLVEMLEFEWWSLYKTYASVMNQFRENFSVQRLLQERNVWWKTLSLRSMW